MDKCEKNSMRLSRDPNLKLQHKLSVIKFKDLSAVRRKNLEKNYSGKTTFQFCHHNS